MGGSICERSRRRGRRPPADRRAARRGAGRPRAGRDRRPRGGRGQERLGRGARAQPAPPSGPRRVRPGPGRPRGGPGPRRTAVRALRAARRRRRPGRSLRRRAGRLTAGPGGGPDRPAAGAGAPRRRGRARTVAPARHPRPGGPGELRAARPGRGDGRPRPVGGRRVPGRARGLGGPGPGHDGPRGGARRRAGGTRRAHPGPGRGLPARHAALGARAAAGAADRSGAAGPRSRPDVSGDRRHLGGLGLAAARRLADRGARGLALLGRRPLPPRADWPRIADAAAGGREAPGSAADPRTAELVRTVLELEGRGVRVLVHTGPLTDRAGLTGFLDRVRGASGPVAGVLHCAGSVDRRPPAFVRRTPGAIAGTWEPKTAGLRVLDELVRADRPDFVVLYSSVSAVLPRLAVGLGDYAAANAHLSAYAAERNAGEGPDGTRYLCVSWGSWTGLGMGEVTAAAYHKAGFGALGRKEGLGLLERVIAGRIDGAVAAAVRPGHFPPLATGPAPLPAALPAPPLGGGAPAADPRADGGTVAAGPVPPVVRPGGAHHGTVRATEPEARTPAQAQAQAPAEAHAHDAAVDETKEPQVTTSEGAPGAAVGAAVEEFLLDLMAQELMLSREAVSADSPFAELGVDSILIAGMVGRLEELADAPLDPSVVLENPTAGRLAAFLTGEHPEGVRRWADRRDPVRVPDRSTAAVSAPRPAAPVPAAVPGPRPLAVIGMASRFPGAPDTDAFWELLAGGRSAIREVPASRWSAAELYAPQKAPGRSLSRWGGFLDGIEEFDPEPFGIAAEDASHVDPLIRLVLECAEQAFRDAGYERPELAGTRTGVFVAAQTGAYAQRVRVPHRATVTGLNQNFAAAQLAQVYDLRGPHLVVDTACSSSLTALSLAEQSMRLGECETALVAAADLLLDEMPYLKLSASGALSPDAECRVFDARANGLVLGEGAGALLLKPLDAALAAGDRVHAVVESVAVNNDGRTMGLTTPNPEAQEEVVRRAHRAAGVDPAAIGMVEAHGTGTMIGDPMELRALTRAFGDGSGSTGYCAVGSVKSNIGHALMAAGMAGLQKAVLALRHRLIPPTLHCETPNPRFAFDRSPFRPHTVLGEFAPLGGARRAGVSAFGFGGVNCHAVLRELTDAEAASRPAVRPALPPAVFHRVRHWVDRDAGTAPAPTPAPVPAAPAAPSPLSVPAPAAGSGTGAVAVAGPILPLEELI
ncbi:KR domain-containing protein [Streptomyces sp. SID8352]|nr:KR domain-containing protein [Streptomyces sp. SID8352]